MDDISLRAPSAQNQQGFENDNAFPLFPLVMRFFPKEGGKEIPRNRYYLCFSTRDPIGRNVRVSL